jgi:hypothetical protein
MKAYHDIGEKKASLLCIECGKRPRAQHQAHSMMPLHYLGERCEECHVEHERQVEAVHRAIGV